MFNVEWIQNDRVVLTCEVGCDRLDLLSCRIYQAVCDLVMAVSFNEDRRIVDLVLYEPLHLRISSSSDGSNYCSASHHSDLSPYAFSTGATADSFASFLTAHLYHATILEYDLGIDYWPIHALLNNTCSSEPDMCLALFSDQMYSVLNMGNKWVENADGKAVFLTDMGFKFHIDFQGLTPSNDLIAALESPLKYMRAFVAIKGRCSTCRQEVSSKDVAYCQKCRRKFSLPYEVAHQQLVSFDIKSLRRSRLAEKDILTAVNLSINGQGRLININDIPF